MSISQPQVRGVPDTAVPNTAAPDTDTAGAGVVDPVAPDPREPIALLLRGLGSGTAGLSDREAARRLDRFGRNELHPRGGATWPRALVKQFTHPLAVLLLLAAVLAFVADTPQLGWAILIVIVLNAGFAFVQERQAGKAVEALVRYLPPQARVRRAGRVRTVPAVEVVPGDVVLISEGDRIPADARLMSGDLQVDVSALTGESAPVERRADAVDTAERLLDAPVLVFSGTSCVGGMAEVVVHATGAHTEIGRIAALAGQHPVGDSPLERQVRRVAYLIAAVALAVGFAFLPLGVIAGLSWAQAAVFAVGLLVANVPEGLLPTITLALAAGVRAMAKRGALVKRLSAVETLGSTTVICTDKTGTLTQGVMHVQEIRDPHGALLQTPDAELAEAVVRCSTADVDARTGDPTELALLDMARQAGVTLPPAVRDADRLRLFPFDSRRKSMATVDLIGGAVRAHVKGAPEVVLPHCRLAPTDRDALTTALDDLTGRGLRVLAIAGRDWSDHDLPDREVAEGPGLTLLGLIALLDPPRPEVPAAIESCHASGIRVHIVTGDNGRTAAEIARRVGVSVDRVVDGPALDQLSEAELERLLTSDGEIVFARALPEAKLRIADALEHDRHVVAMTGDGVNDAPALRHADIGVAMGRSGTEVAREAATMVLTDDNFATVVAGVEEGRRVYDNVRKFVLYIFAHAVPEVIPFLVFALSGGVIPLPLTVLQILAIDLGTETLPALALGREPAEPGIMARPPRPRGQNVIDRAMLLRAWGLMGLASAVLTMGLFLLVLLSAGWAPGDPTGPGSPLHDGYLQATTASFAAIVACQVGTAFAARTQHSSLRAIGLTTNRLLLGGIAFELVFAAAVIYLPALQSVFGTAALPAWAVAALLPMPVIVWGVDEIYRALRRRSTSGPAVVVPALDHEK
jgi:calcium-translocating P-type ATPase